MSAGKLDDRRIARGPAGCDDCSSRVTSRSVVRRVTHWVGWPPAGRTASCRRLAIYFAGITALPGGHRAGPDRAGPGRASLGLDDTTATSTKTVVTRAVAVAIVVRDYNISTAANSLPTAFLLTRSLVRFLTYI